MGKKLSSKELSSEDEVLRTDSSLPLHLPEILASVEEGIFHLQYNDKQLVIAEVSSILKGAKPPPRNVDLNIFKALLALEKDPDRIELLADKGNCVVVMDKHESRDKVLYLLNEKNTYSVLKSDPTSKTQRKLHKHSLQLKKARTISKNTYKMLFSNDDLAP